MEIIKELNGKELTVKLIGALDTTTYPQFEQEVIPALVDINRLILDLKELSYISSAGLRVILIAQKRMYELGELIVRNVNPDIMNIFTMTGFVNFLTIE